MSPKNSEAERFNKPNKYGPRYPQDGRTFSVPSLTSVSDTVSLQESLKSVPSLHQLSDTKIGVPPRNDKVQLKHAFTTDELQLNEVNMLYSRPTTSTQPACQFVDWRATKKLSRHGVMSANTENNVTSMGGPAAHRSISYTIHAAAGSNPSLRAKPTVTTILRQQHVLELAEKRERERLDSLMLLNPNIFESNNVVRQKERKESEEVKAAEAKRLLQAKLAYERARAASRKVIDEKQRIAEGARQKQKEWQAQLSEQRQAEVSRRKSMTEQLQKSFSESRRSVDEMLRLKQNKAAQVKLEMEQLQQEAKQKQKAEEIKRQDKIQQIQASKLALKRTKETMGNPNQFYRSIAIPETQIKLRLQKEEETRKLEETRKKIQAAKQTKSVKLIRAMKKIQRSETAPKQQQPPKTPEDLGEMFRINQFMSTSISLNTQQNDPTKANKEKTGGGDINEMLQELTQLKEKNHLQKLAEEQSRKGRITGTMSPLKVIGASNILRNDRRISDSKNLSSSQYNPLKRDSNSPFNKRFGLRSVETLQW